MSVNNNHSHQPSSSESLKKINPNKSDLDFNQNEVELNTKDHTTSDSDTHCTIRINTNKQSLITSNIEANHSLESQIQREGLLTKPFIVGASVIGSSHLKSGQPCEDAFSYTQNGNMFAIAVSDGVGNTKFGGIGSNECVISIIDKVNQYFESHKFSEKKFSSKCFIVKLVRVGRNSLQLLANNNGCSINEYACTLILVIGTKESINVAHIGDGGVVAKRNGIHLELISAPNATEYANTVYPITMKGWEKKIQYSFNVKNVNCISAFTDGCQSMTLKKKNNKYSVFSNFYNPFFEYFEKLTVLEKGIRDLTELLKLKLSNYSDDDKTFVTVVL